MQLVSLQPHYYSASVLLQKTTGVIAQKLSSILQEAIIFPTQLLGVQKEQQKGMWHKSVPI